MTFRANVRRFGFGLMLVGLGGVVAGRLNADGASARGRTNGGRRDAGEAVEKDTLHRVREGSKLVNQLGEFRVYRRERPLSSAGGRTKEIMAGPVL